MSEETRTVSITINLRELYYSVFNLAAERVGSKTVSFSGPVERNYEITYPSVGKWKVVVNRVSDNVFVHGDWLNEERNAQIEAWEIDPVIIARKKAYAVVSILHKEQNWFLKRVESEIDEEGKTTSLRVIEDRAEGDFPAQTWTEDVNIELSFPKDGRWRIELPNYDYSIRYVQPEIGKSEHGGELYGRGISRKPKVITFPSEVYADEETTCSIVMDLDEQVERFAGVDIDYNSANRAIYVKAYTLFVYNQGEGASPDYLEEFQLKFSQDGQWLIIFSGVDAEPLIKVLNVLPAR